MWAGVDVGGRRKGFHAAVVDDARLVAGPAALPAPADVVDWLAGRAVDLVAVDSPRAAAGPGTRSRAGERSLARTICGIRYTPDERRLAASPAYYEWIAHGLELYGALAAAGYAVIECFPTASWTRWAGPRRGRSRRGWSREALDARGLADAPARLNQDGRDAIGAALTARAHSRGETDAFGDIVVPRVSRGSAA
jgi:predicted nuclease with RNAse H fold